jgi:nicotinamidase/pyrazinamidase
MAVHKVSEGDALIVTDVQNDFLPGGSLAVEGGEQVIGPLNACIALFTEKGLPIFATRDWHPPDHCSFVEQGGPWPPHCVAESPGAAFPADLAISEEAVVISKAQTPEKEAYSSFEGTDLHQRLANLGVKRLFIGGLTTDYCVLTSVLDALKLGYEAYLLTDAIRAVNAHPGDGEQALERMRTAGAITIKSTELA